MAKLGKTLLKFLLIITMMVEPATFAYAMAGMDHHQRSDACMDAGNAQHQASPKSHNLSILDDASNNSHDVAKGNCCSMTTCCSAVITTTTQPISDGISDPYFSYKISWSSIVIPSETKPPRSHFG